MTQQRVPAVSVVIATRGRPELLRCAVRAALAQDHVGELEVIVVFDQVEVDRLDDVVLPANRLLRVMANVRTVGLAGARNTGILEARGKLIAFCDDDDEWSTSKLRLQEEALVAEPEAILAATGIRIETETGSHVRLPEHRTEFSQLLDSRITEIHPSSFLLRRSDLLGRVGLVDEDLPASYGEDYDLLLRAARLGHIVSVNQPLVLVRWNRVSFFTSKWRGIADGLQYLLAKHPEFSTTAIGSARLEGQIAFALAALGERKEARSWALRAIRHDRSQLRAFAALAIAARIAPPGLLVQLVNNRGRGL